jgi:hypothetical protein
MWEETDFRLPVVILDCCFSGRADGSLGTAVADAFGLTYIRGTYLLASAAPEEWALAKAGADYTAFSGELIRLLRDGDPDGPARLYLGHIYEYLSRALPAQQIPRPYRQTGGSGDRLIIAPNTDAETRVRPHVLHLRPGIQPGRQDRRVRGRRRCRYHLGRH